MLRVLCARNIYLTLYLFAALTANADPADYLTSSDSWFSGQDAKIVASNILSWQSSDGGWPKNVPTTKKLYIGEIDKLKPTYDNKATVDELRFLARIYSVTGRTEYLTAFNQGLDYVLTGQYPNGGWPQFHPPGKKYHRLITFNDQVMVRLLYFVREVANNDLYKFLDQSKRQQAAKAFEKGVNCILKCQVRIQGKLTVWCAQHDEKNYQPMAARSFEPPALSGCESVGITRLLMSLKNPSPEVQQAVESAVEWFIKAKLTGIKLKSIKDEKGRKDRVVVKETDSPAIWARFYSIENCQPVFGDRDGKIHKSINEISYERRNGYSWYGQWPVKLIDTEYSSWKKRLSLK